MLNIAELRVYYYPAASAGGERVVHTFPVSIGRMDWKTPMGLTKVVAKDIDPPWRPPASIKAEHAKEGDILPDVVPGGPDNPLGRFAMRLGVPGYLIHGTNKPFGIGMRVTHGCVRMLSLIHIYTDKGTGNGLHDLTTNRVGLINGARVDAAAAGGASHFTADLSDAERTAFNARYPDRVAYKHAHSQQNPEQDWGRNTLQAIVFAFYVLNERYGTPNPRGGNRTVLDRANTLVIASGISNGAGAALAAAKQDRNGLIDGVAVTEPNVQTTGAHRLLIQQGATSFPVVGRPLFDYFTHANLYHCLLYTSRL